MSPLVALAQVFTAGPWHVNGMIDRAFECFYEFSECVERIAVRCRLRFPVKPNRLELEYFLQTDREVQELWKAAEVEIDDEVLPSEIPLMRPAFGPPRTWHAKELLTPLDVASLLEVSYGELQWLAGLLPRDSSGSQHYRCRWAAKRRGWRLIEAPKNLLKKVQRSILENVLGAIPIHDAVHGYCKGRDVVSCVQPHVMKSFCLKMDLQQFFPSIGVGKVVKIFRTIGYPREVAWLLSRLCTVATPRDVLVQMPQQVDSRICCASVNGQVKTEYQAFANRHLPQGSPTSPYLANLAAFELDCRLSGFAQSQGVVYTRYADDLLFSGECVRKTYWRWFHSIAAAIVLECGFEVSYRKSRWMPKSQRQSALGVVANAGPNIRRDDFERLKATLFNCVRFGPASQNHNSVPHFREHLLGKIQWVRLLNPDKAEKLQRLFRMIDWA